MCCRDIYINGDGDNKISNYDNRNGENGIDSDDNNNYDKCNNSYNGHEIISIILRLLMTPVMIVNNSTIVMILKITTTKTTMIEAKDDIKPVLIQEFAPISHVAFLAV